MISPARLRPLLHRRTLARVFSLLGFAGTVVMFAGLAPGCRRPEASAPAAAATPGAAGATTAAAPSPAAAEAAFAARFPASGDCRSCHEEIYKNWSASHHALAQRNVDEKLDRPTVDGVQEFSAHGVDYRVEWKDGRPHFTEKRGTSPAETYLADYILGHTPIYQFVVPVGGGRFQAAELAFDPIKKEFFNVFGDERRQPGEWGHWRGRGMNWNSMCAHCHSTGYRKNYDPVRDTYSTTWREHGIGCAQCHEMPADHAATAKPNPNPPALPAEQVFARRQLAQETCAPCHARNELLTGDLRPGVRYHDHYRITLPTDAAVFYPDGQVLDEDFNWTSLITSRMGGKAGVTCLDCHDPHSGKTILPVQNNAICMQCHSAPGRNHAPVIDPVAHSHHLPGSTGNQCVTCHMPTTTYMQRDPRHDHGFTKPDPLLTKELGIPNACSRCHTDKPVDWAVEHAEKWYGDKLAASRQRQRTRVVAAAQAGKPEALEQLLAMIASEDIPAWKATMTLLTRNYVGVSPRVMENARTALKDPDPLVRSAGAQIVASVPAETPALQPLLHDAARLVRLDAAWALSPTLGEGTPARKELDAYLAVSADQPAGRMRIGQDLFNRGRAVEAEAQMRKATEWDPNSAGIHEAHGIILNELGRSDEAAAALWRAARLNPADYQVAFNAALAFAGARKLADAELAFREALRRNPRFDRAHYNLGLLLAQTGRIPEGITSLRTAEEVNPRVADYPYARATLHWQRGERDAALAAARRALEIDPAHPQARQLLNARP